jgi:hypothetical protein
VTRLIELCTWVWKARGITGPFELSTVGLNGCHLLDEQHHGAIVLSVLIGVGNRRCQSEKFIFASLRHSLSVLQGADQDSAAYAYGKTIREVLRAFSWLRIHPRSTGRPIFNFAPAQLRLGRLAVGFSSPLPHRRPLTNSAVCRDYPPEPQKSAGSHQGLAIASLHVLHRRFSRSRILPQHATATPHARGPRGYARGHRSSDLTTQCCLYDTTQGSARRVTFDSSAVSVDDGVGPPFPMPRGQQGGSPPCSG